MNSLKKRLETGQWVYVKSPKETARSLVAIHNGSGMHPETPGKVLNCYFPFGINPAISITVDAMQLDPHWTEIASRLQYKMEDFMKNLSKEELALFDSLFS